MVDYSVVNSLIQIAWCCFWLSKYLLKLKYPHWRECCFLPPWGEGNSLCNSICLAKQKTGPALTDAGAWHHMRGRRRRSRDTMWRGRFQQCRRSSSSTSTMSISVCLRRISNLPGRSDRKVELTFRGQWLGSVQPELETSQHGWWRRGRIFCGGFFCCFFLTPPQQHNEQLRCLTSQLVSFPSQWLWDELIACWFLLPMRWRRSIKAMHCGWKLKLNTFRGRYKQRN